jgi:sec-independent protein translocase protein TatA
MGELAPDKILVIVIVAFLLFGAKRLPEFGASLGKGIREFKRSLSEPPEFDAPAGEAPSQPTAPRQMLPPPTPVTFWQPKRLPDRS